MRKDAIIAKLRQENAELKDQLAATEFENGWQREGDHHMVPDWKFCGRCGEPTMRRVGGELRCWGCDG